MAQANIDIQGTVSLFDEHIKVTERSNSESEFKMLVIWQLIPLAKGNSVPHDTTTFPSQGLTFSILLDEEPMSMHLGMRYLKKRAAYSDAKARLGLKAPAWAQLCEAQA